MRTPFCFVLMSCLFVFRCRVSLFGLRDSTVAEEEKIVSFGQTSSAGEQCTLISHETLPIRRQLAKGLVLGERVLLGDTMWIKMPL
jgi:hypothetical protein